MADIASSAPTGRSRLDSVDFLRGLVMVVMALDHTRDFLTNARFDPLDLSKTTAAYFFTRWITHFCAPVFVFLAGTGARLSLSRRRTKGELSRFLATRGLWLVVVELTLVRFGWTFNFTYDFSVLQVIWVIGVSMIVLSALVRLPNVAVTTIGIFMIASHNLLDGIAPERFGSAAWLWRILHVQGVLAPFPNARIFVMYPLIPWIGVMAAGYGFGGLYALDSERRRAWLIRLGSAMTALFVVLRAANIYGDPHRWAMQKSGLMTLCSLLNCEKYPPSFLFLLMTLGPAIFFLAFLEQPAGPLKRKIIVFGRVPFFYYVLHLPLFHLLSVALYFARYGPAVFTFSFQNPPPPGSGFGLPVVYAVWAGGVALLYFPCRWFAGVKSRNKSAWLSYF